MNKRVIDKAAKNEDHFGNNIAITCPVCAKVYVVSAFLKDSGGEKGKRICPSCGKSTGFVSADEAYVTWAD